jgi:hypothetical protein
VLPHIIMNGNTPRNAPRSSRRSPPSNTDHTLPQLPNAKLVRRPSQQQQQPTTETHPIADCLVRPSATLEPSHYPAAPSDRIVRPAMRPLPAALQAALDRSAAPVVPARASQPNVGRVVWTPVKRQRPPSLLTDAADAAAVFFGEFVSEGGPGGGGVVGRVGSAGPARISSARAGGRISPTPSAYLGGLAVAPKSHSLAAPPAPLATGEGPACLPTGGFTGAPTGAPSSLRGLLLHTEILRHRRGDERFEAGTEAAAAPSPRFAHLPWPDGPTAAAFAGAGESKQVTRSARCRVRRWHDRQACCPTEVGSRLS